MNRLPLFRSGSGSTRRLLARRRPILEDLEGRLLLSNGHHYDMASPIMVPQIRSVADVQKVREAADRMSPDAAGQHYGTRVADVQKVREASISFNFTKM